MDNYYYLHRAKAGEPVASDSAALSGALVDGDDAIAGAASAPASLSGALSDGAESLAGAASVPFTYAPLKSNVDRRPILYYDNADRKVYASEIRDTNGQKLAVSAASPFTVAIRSMKWIEEKGWLLMAFGDYAGGTGGGVHIIELNVPTILEHTGVSGFDCTGIDYDRRDGKIYFVDNTNNQLKSIPSPSSTVVTVEMSLGAAAWSGLGICDNNDAFASRDLFAFEGNNLVSIEKGNLANKATVNTTTSCGGTSVHMVTNTDEYAPTDNNLIVTLAGTKGTLYLHKMSAATGVNTGAVRDPGGAAVISQPLLTAKGPWVKAWLKQTVLYSDILLDTERSSQAPSFADNTRTVTGHGAEVQTTPIVSGYTHYACIERFWPVWSLSEDNGFYVQPTMQNANQFRFGHPRGVSRAHAFAIDTDNDQIYIAGGATAAPVYLLDLYRFDPVSGTWTRLADGPVGLGSYFGNMGYYNGALYYFGGTDGTVRNTIHKYTIATNSWSTLAATLPTALRDFELIEDGSSFYILGGTTNGFAERTARIHRFNAIAETVTVDIGTLPGISNLSATGCIRGGTVRLRGGTANYTQEQRVENIRTTATPTGVGVHSGTPGINSTYGITDRDVEESATAPYFHHSGYSGATANLKGPFDKLFPAVGAVPFSNRLTDAGAGPRRAHYQGRGLLYDRKLFLALGGLTQNSGGLQQMSLEVGLVEGDWPAWTTRAVSKMDDAKILLHANILRYFKGMQTTNRKLSNWIELIGRNDFIQDTDSERPNYDGDGADANFKVPTVTANGVTNGKLVSRTGQTLDYTTGATFHIRARSLNEGSDKIQLDTRNAALTAGLSIGQVSRSVRLKVPGVGTRTSGVILATSGIEDVCVRINAGATAADVFVNGVFAETLDITGNGGGNHSDTWSVFSGRDGAVFIGDMVSVCAWDRALTNQEIADVRTEHRQMACDTTYEV